MKPGRFDYYRADSTEHAISLLGDLGDDAKVLAGGQSLIPLMNFRLASPTALVDVGHIEDSDRITVDGDGVRIGLGVRQYRALGSSELVAAAPLVAKGLKLVGHEAIRNRGTVCGSTAHADPAAELPAIWLALDAEMVVRGAGGDRHVPAAEFFTSPFTTVIDADELLAEIRIPHAPEPARRRTAINEVSRRHGDFAIAGAVVAIDVDERERVVDARISLLGVADIPLRVERAEQVMRGALAGDPEAHAAAAEEVRSAIDPRTDNQASSKFRKNVAATLVRRSLAECGVPTSTTEDAQ